MHVQSRANREPQINPINLRHRKISKREVPIIQTFSLRQTLEIILLQPSIDPPCGNQFARLMIHTTTMNM